MRNTSYYLDSSGHFHRWGTRFYCSEDMNVEVSDVEPASSSLCYHSETDMDSRPERVGKASGYQSKFDAAKY